MSFHSTRSFLDAPSARSSQQWRGNLENRSLQGSNTSLDTVQRPYHYRSTPGSLRSIGSLSRSPLRVRNENVQPSRVLSHSNFPAGKTSLYPSSKHSSNLSSRRVSREIIAPIPQRCRPPPAFTQDPNLSLEDVPLSSPSVQSDEDDGDSDKENDEPLNNYPRLSFDVAKEEVLSVNESSLTAPQRRPRPLSDTPVHFHHSHSFKRWISQLKPQTSRQKKSLSEPSQRWPLDESPTEGDTKTIRKMASTRSGHKKSDSRSSAGFIDTVKAAVWDRSAGSPAHGKSRRSNLFSRSNRGSKVSEEDGRPIEQPQGLISTLDDVALGRAHQRERILEEIVESEAGYVADLKVLIHVR
ncbi:MAG: hypothetical protein Q9174_005963 [Haloplaca sp. 1 TL-2023]